MQNDKNKIKPRALGIGMLGKQSTTESFPLWSPFLLLHTLNNRVTYLLEAFLCFPHCSSSRSQKHALHLVLVRGIVNTLSQHSPGKMTSFH